MVNHGTGWVRLDYIVPARGLIGFRTDFLTETRGTGLLHHVFDGWLPWQGEIQSRNRGSLVADRLGVTTSNAILNLQERGTFFVDVGDDVYEGMIIGEMPKAGDMDVNVCKEKKHTNVRAAAADELVRLTPPKKMSLEQSLEFIGDDEAIEVTPDKIRLRKVELDATTRLRAAKNLKRARDGKDMSDTLATFADLGVSKPVVAALSDRGVDTAFPIQQAVIEAALAGRDILGKAPTGSGKTLAFGIPTVERAGPGDAWSPSALILSPTRELATQIKQELEPLAKARSRRIGTVFGGTNINTDIKLLERGVDILVACPGRLEDLIARRCVELRDAHVVVVDEADRMADMGFLPAVKRILDLTPDDRHTLLFSATLDNDVDALIKRYQNDPLTVEVEETIDLDAADVEHHWYLVESHNRVDAAAAILRGYWSSIVFCRTRRGCDRVAKMLSKRDLVAVAIHGDRSQAQRERALRDFTSGRAQVLVATDVAARGIHVDDVSLVMHYDPAGSDKDYVHRSGRTGRAGRSGRVISLVVTDKEKIARQLQRDLGVEQGFSDLDLDQLPPPLAFEPTEEPPPAHQRQAKQPKQSTKPAGDASGRQRNGKSTSDQRRRKQGSRRNDGRSSNDRRDNRRPRGERRDDRPRRNDETSARRERPRRPTFAVRLTPRRAPVELDQATRRSTVQQPWCPASRRP